MTAIRRTGTALHRILLAFPTALFPAAMITDIAYLRTAQIQWSNFSAWLITGGLVFGGLVLVWSLAELALAFRTAGRAIHAIYAGLLAAMCLLGLVDAFKHSQDAWSSVGTFGLILSILCALLAIAAAALAFSGLLHPEVDQ
ncbi:MAG: hypothetical protein H2038_12415 [Brevundimonas sp.]|uniref:DUF2231 domain-containing protein n=1 Tax=Brevundimonas sp. TaxID=1871086 RepID=UPI0017C70E68|nr:DUF2231 domain-containing protein [Brevundimonas sp.]MBA4805444.1 hypothetical protein [Brevundimonas sp.]